MEMAGCKVLDAQLLLSWTLCDVAAVNSAFVCSAAGAELMTQAVDFAVDSPRLLHSGVYTFNSEVKYLLLAPVGDLVAVLTVECLSVLCLKELKEVLSTSKAGEPWGLQWHPKLPGLLLVYSEQILTVFLWGENESFSAEDYGRPGVVCYAVSPAEDLEVALVTESGALLLWAVRTSEEQDLARVQAATSVSYIDEEHLCVIGPEGVTVFDKGGLKLNSIPGHFQVAIDLPTETYLLYDLATTVTLMDKQEILSDSGNSYSFFITRPLELFILKPTSPGHVCVVAKHNGDLLFYTVDFPYELLTEKSEYEEKLDNEEFPVAISELEGIYPESIPKEEEQSGELQKKEEAKRKKEKHKQKQKKEKKKERGPVTTQEIKELVQPIIGGLSLKLDEIIRKVDKSLNEKTLNTVINKSLQSTASQRNQDDRALKASIQGTLISALKSEFISSLIPKFEADLLDAFNKMTHILENILKTSAERNAREEAKSYSLSQQLKSSVENMTSLNRRVNKVAFKQMRKVAELESSLAEKIKNMPVEPETNSVPSRGSELKEELDKLLAEHQFDRGLQRALQERTPNVLFRVLECINPGPLLRSQALCTDTLFELFDSLLQSIGEEEEFPELYSWLAEIVSNIPMVHGRNRVMFQKLIESAPSNAKLWRVIEVYSSRFN